MISKRKTKFLENGPVAFEKENASKNDTVDTQELYAQIGQLKAQNEILKKLQQAWDVKQRAV